MCYRHAGLSAYSYINVTLKAVRLLLQKSKEQLDAQSNRVRVRLWLNCS